MIKCDPRAKAKCPFKNPCCVDEEAYFLEGSDCDKFNQEVLSPPPTNADRIRAMSDEELAWFLGQGISGCMRTTTVCEVDLSCRECFLNWLKQPVEDTP